MNENVNKSALFNGSCFALITTAFTFSIRAGILPQLGEAFGLSAEQLGFINSMWFFGFPISMIIGGLVYHTFGPKNIMMVAFVCHTIGILLTIFAGGYTTLLISTLLIGIGNGCTEAACNPMIADMYSGCENAKNARPVPYVVSRRDTCWLPYFLLHDPHGFRLGSTDVGHDDPNRHLCCFIFRKNFSKSTIGRGKLACGKLQGNVKPGLYLPVLAAWPLQLFRSLVQANG